VPVRQSAAPEASPATDLRRTADRSERRLLGGLIPVDAAWDLGAMDHPWRVK
jgi:hypothetical protein